jgi:hypothetical protein
MYRSKADHYISFGNSNSLINNSIIVFGFIKIKSVMTKQIVLKDFTPDLIFKEAKFHLSKFS